MMPAAPPGPLQTLTAEASSARREGQAVAAERAQQPEIRDRRVIARPGDLEPEIHHDTPTVPPDIPAQHSKSTGQAGCVTVLPDCLLKSGPFNKQKACRSQRSQPVTACPRLTLSGLSNGAKCLIFLCPLCVSNSVQRR